MPQKVDRLAFIAKTIQLKEGLDLYVGTVKAAKRIVRALVREMGVNFSDSAKLVGRRDGKDIYRVDLRRKAASISDRHDYFG